MRYSEATICPHQRTSLADSRSVSPATAASALRQIAQDFAPRASVPYSQSPRAVAALLSDGIVVPGVRVESASYSLVIPAVLNAVSTCFALGRDDLVAVAAPDALLEREIRYLDAYLGAATTFDGFMRLSGHTECPKPGALINPIESGSDSDGIARARLVAERAHVPESDFPVGCVCYVDTGWIPGVNVEHPDWSMTLCAERNLVGTLVTFGVSGIDAVYLSALKDKAASPCGACRQLLSEYLRGATIYTDRGTAPPACESIDTLLPGSFTGEALRH